MYVYARASVFTGREKQGAGLQMHYQAQSRFILVFFLSSPAVPLCVGEGIANLFMRPYNFKVWAIPPVNMQCEWLGERASTIDVKQAVRSVLRGRRAPAPKAYFRFPQVCGCKCVLVRFLSLSLSLHFSLYPLWFFFSPHSYCLHVVSSRSYSCLSVRTHIFVFDHLKTRID